MEYLLLLNPNHFTWRRAALGSVTANSRWRLLSAQWEAIVFVKVQNNRDSASKAITKFVLQWGRYKPSFPSTNELNGCTNHLWLNWCRVNKSNIQWPMSIDRNIASSSWSFLPQKLWQRHRLRRTERRRDQQAAHRDPDAGQAEEARRIRSNRRLHVQVTNLEPQNHAWSSHCCFWEYCYTAIEATWSI